MTATNDFQYIYIETFHITSENISTAQMATFFWKSIISHVQISLADECVYFFPHLQLNMEKCKKKKKEIGNQSLKETWYMSISIVTLECVLYVHVYAGCFCLLK